MTQTDTPIADEVTEVRSDAAKRLPAAVNEVFAANIAQLNERGIPANAQVTGTPVPDGDLLDVHGEPTTLTAARDGRAAVVVFYRGGWCPYCNVALRAYQQSLSGELDSLGVALIAISPQKPDQSLSVAEKHDLSFTVLSDPGNQIARQLGIVFTLDEETRGAQAQLGLDIADVNADGTYELPLATTLVVDAGGVLRWIDVHPDYTTRSEPAEIMAAVRGL